MVFLNKTVQLLLEIQTHFYAELSARVSPPYLDRRITGKQGYGEHHPRANQHIPGTA